MSTFAQVRAHLVRRRRQLRLSQEALAECAGVEVDVVKHLENKANCVIIPGDGRSPKHWDQFAAICKELDEEPLGLLARFGLIQRPEP